MVRPKHSLLILLILFFLGATVVAQDREKIKRLTPTHKGTTGLFNLAVADTLRQGEFSISAAIHKFNRDPGEFDFTIFPVTFTVGLHDRIELFASMEAYKRTHANGLVVNKLLPRDPIVPSRLNDRQTPGGIPGFFNDAPFMDVGFGDGTGDLWAGMKFNLLSERRGNPFGFAVQPIARFHLTDNRQHLLRGLTSGATDAGFDVILSKDLPGGGTLTGNAGLLFAGDLLGADRQNSLNWGGGFEVPLGTPMVNLVGEVLGRHFYGSKNTGVYTNDSDPMDAYAGLRLFPARWMALTAAASYHLTGTDVPGMPDANCLGFYVQTAFQRKINRPPVVECSVNPSTVIVGDSARITASIYDPDDDVLSISWRASGGRLTETNSSATLDTTGLTPGRYTVNVEVSDGDNVVPCSVDITVERRKAPPTIRCEPSSVNVTMGESVTLNVQASDPNNLRLRYSWTVNDQSVPADAATFQFGTVGRSPGNYRVRVTATNEDDLSASCEFTVNVVARPVVNPTCSLSLSPTAVIAGETVTATGTASHPENEPMTYSWLVDGQSRPGTATTLQINTTGMTGGSHSVTFNVRGERGGTCTATQSFAVTEKIIIQMDGTRADNRVKAQLDEIALKMQQNPQLRARVTGHTDSRGTEAANLRTGQQRADSVKDYLVTQHNLDANRIEATSAGQAQPIADNATAEGRQQNRRVEIELFVP
jgi:outer membrane protein OmpA-like peptidoglycan-associated protein